MTSRLLSGFAARQFFPLAMLALAGCASFGTSFDEALGEGLHDAPAPVRAFHVDVDASEVHALTESGNTCWAPGESAAMIRNEVAQTLENIYGASATDAWARIRIDVNDVTKRDGLAGICWYFAFAVGFPCGWTTASASAEIQLGSGRVYRGHGESYYLSGLYYNFGSCQRYGRTEGSAVATALTQALAALSADRSGGGR